MFLPAASAPDSQAGASTGNDKEIEKVSHGV
jgi:hypothetical protein